MKNRSLVHSFNNAFSGLIYVIRSQRNMKIHIAAAVLVFVAAVLVNLSRVELSILIILISVVFVAELMNTAIEATIDTITTELDPTAKIAKDVAAAAVLISAGTALFVGYLVFINKLNPVTLKLLLAIKQEPIHLTYISIILVFIISVAIKALTGNEDSITRGGMPSVHSAISFAAATAIAFITENAFAATLAILMAFLVLETRLEMGVHTTFEVFIGAVLGALITIFIFQLAG